MRSYQPKQPKKKDWLDRAGPASGLGLLIMAGAAVLGLLPGQERQEVEKPVVQKKYRTLNEEIGGGNNYNVIATGAPINPIPTPGPQTPDPEFVKRAYERFRAQEYRLIEKHSDGSIIGSHMFIDGKEYSFSAKDGKLLFVSGDDVQYQLSRIEEKNE